MLVPELTSSDLDKPLDLKTIQTGKFAQAAHINLIELQRDCEVGKKGDLHCCLSLICEGKPVSIIYPPERMSAFAMACLLKVEEATKARQ